MNTCEQNRALIEKALASFLPAAEGRSDRLVLDAAAYSLLAGGKRVRPVLLLSFAALFGVPEEEALPFALSLECIHTYSLIHDDLPCMDNDDLRRGRPTNHKVYGEAMALLAGDALLNYAYEQLFSHAKTPDQVAAAARIAKDAGVCGMIGGQCIDLEYEGKPLSPALLEELQDKKTAALLRAACVGGARLGTSDPMMLDAAEKYATEVGLAFQIVDDILDVEGNEADLGKTIGKDAKEGKNTFVSLFGLSEAKRMAKEHTENALAALKQIPNAEALLREYTQFLLIRGN